MCLILLFVSNFSVFLCSDEWSDVLSAAPQGSSPPPPPHHRSPGSFYEGEQCKVMGHKLLIRAFLGLIVGFVSAPSVSILPHSRGSNEALCDMMSPLRTPNHSMKGPGSSERAEANGEKLGAKDIRERLKFQREVEIKTAAKDGSIKQRNIKRRKGERAFRD